MSDSTRGRGRPVKFTGAGEIRQLKNLVNKLGLVAAAEKINSPVEAGGGLVYGNKRKPVTVSLPTLSKIVQHSEVGGPNLTLKRGRKAAA